MASGTSYELFSDEYFMNEALKEAVKAFDKQEVPVGAVIVCGNEVLARAYNLTETLNDVTAHAEMQAFTAAASGLGGKYLNECTLYVTLEPCVMCAGAAFWTHIGRIIFGADDEKRGYRLVKYPLLHPKTEVISGVLAEQSSTLLKVFFKKKRIGG
ncbi:MAG: nucleoside deaminase [Bacteroidales bacterium]|nr:nucleoside deaminase [Bacteroidales bacterium]